MQPTQGTLVVDPTLKVKDEIYTKKLETHADKGQECYLSYVWMLIYNENNKGDKVSQVH